MQWNRTSGCKITASFIYWHSLAAVATKAPVSKQPGGGMYSTALQRFHMRQYPFTGISCLSQEQAQRDLQNHYMHRVTE